VPTMRELSRWIRDYVRDPRNQKRLMADEFSWYQICVAMDIIDDVGSALDAYIDNEFPADIGERYLRIYGAMQGLFLQQDALSDLVKTIHPTKKIQLNDVLKDIREARNASVGHPTQLKRHGSLSVHGIVQNSMSKDGFNLLSYPSHDDNLFQYVPVLPLIEKQRVETERILTEVVTELREQEDRYRAQFRDTKLVATFHLVGYAFEKIFEGIRRDSVANMRPWGVGHLQKVLDGFEGLLKQRGIHLDTYDTIEYLYEGISHPLAELTKFISEEPSEVQSPKSAIVFADALQGYFDRLRGIANDIDEEYASEPDPIVQAVRPDVPITFSTTIMGE
jgi:hypothetical protein